MASRPVTVVYLKRKAKSSAKIAKVPCGRVIATIPDDEPEAHHRNSEETYQRPPRFVSSVYSWGR